MVCARRRTNLARRDPRGTTTNIWRAMRGRKRRSRANSLLGGLCSLLVDVCSLPVNFCRRVPHRIGLNVREFSGLLALNGLLLCKSRIKILHESGVLRLRLLLKRQIRLLNRFFSSTTHG